MSEKPRSSIDIFFKDISGHLNVLFFLTVSAPKKFLFARMDISSWEERNYPYKFNVSQNFKQLTITSGQMCKIMANTWFSYMVNAFSPLDVFFPSAPLEIS